MSFNDDQPVISLPNSVPRSSTNLEERIELKRRYKSLAPLEETDVKVLLEIKGGDSVVDRPGLDLVAVLDLSGSMTGEKIEKLKIAMLFVIKKLSPIDRLAIVTFSKNAQRLCILRPMTEDAQIDLEHMVKGLMCHGSTNIKDGLLTGLKVLRDRRYSDGRVVGIILMSDGEQNAGGSAAEVSIGQVPVHTFGLGMDQDPMVLKAIADNSNGGTFSDVHYSDSLSLAFAQCLAGLLTVVLQDLELTISLKESTIKKVSVGSYLQSKEATTGSITVRFGDLYHQEVRKVLIYLCLPISDERSTDVLVINYSYSIEGKRCERNPSNTVTVRRTERTIKQPEKPKVVNEEARIRTSTSIKEARNLADDGRIDDAREKLSEALNSLEDLVEDPTLLIYMLRYEIKLFLDFMESSDIYGIQGRAFALSCESSHAYQRIAARGDVESLRLFATKRMDNYIKQAKLFDEDPSKPPPTVNEDEEKYLIALKKDLENYNEFLNNGQSSDADQHRNFAASKGPPSMDENVKEDPKASGEGSKLITDS